ncbi:ABC transporter permease [Vulcaniibacterium thermophilum]|uniref:Membrane protein n=1 Tax=Vulcaniibacterium thermophilum TaxID=1169913 RepID=A0A919DDN7_9GAMM|nr:ABC transporter permease [Vulcaniibacterium thermophilum]GHE39066.1 membrane protein [Vulcaniibacterium thermophilum]
MKRIMRWLANLGVVLALAAGLAVWIALPWFGVLAVAAVLAAWLLLSRRGQQTLAVASVGVSSLPQRWGASSVIVVGIAGVVGVLVAMLAMGEGFKATLNRTGNETTAIILRGGSQAETNSVITRDQVPLIGQLDGIARSRDGRPLVSPELSQVVSLVTRADGTDANAQLRGVGAMAWELRPQVRIVEGRRFEPGRRELVVGRGAREQYVGLEVGRTLELANQPWTVVGVFESGDSHESELWADAEVLGPTYQRTAFQSVTVKLDGKRGLARLKAAMAADPRLKLDVETTRHYYNKQSAGLTRLIQILGTVVGAIMAVGAVFGALNTMYAAVAARAREIATLRAIGFRGLPVVVAVMLETMLLALLGGLIGALLAWLVFNGYTASTLSGNFSQVVFQFQVGPELVWTGLKWALGIGLVGGLFPALRAARLPVTEALRAA